MKKAWNDTRPPLSPKVVEWIISKIKNLDYGDVKILVRQGRVVQIGLEVKQRHHEVLDELDGRRLNLIGEKMGRNDI